MSHHLPTIRKITLSETAAGVLEDSGDPLARAVLNRAVLALASRRDAISDTVEHVVTAGGAARAVSFWSFDDDAWGVALAVPARGSSVVAATVRFAGAVATVDTLGVSDADQVAVTALVVADAATGPHGGVTATARLDRDPVHWEVALSGLDRLDMDEVETIERMLGEDLAPLPVVLTFGRSSPAPRAELLALA